MTFYGVDCSDWQEAALPWPAWYAAGWRVAIPRAQVGFWDDRHYARYVSEAHAAGFTLGAYHAILAQKYYDVTQQAREFLALIGPHIAFLVLDDEAPGVSGLDVVTWVRYVLAHSTLPLYLYGNWELAAHIAVYPELAELPVWWAAYVTYPNLTTLPPYATPRNVPVELRDNVASGGWQYAGGNGRLPPYQGAIDLSVWYSLPNGVPVPPPVDTVKAQVAVHAKAIKGLVS